MTGPISNTQILIGYQSGFFETNLTENRPLFRIFDIIKKILI